MKGITVVTRRKNTYEVLQNQLKDLLGDMVNIKGYYLDEHIKGKISDDLIMVSSGTVYEQAKDCINKDCPVIIARRSINYYEIDKVLEIPEGTDVLIVNDLPHTTFEAISLLKALGIDHINYFPYYPGIENYPRLDLAITVGEIELIPEFVKKVIDIKVRKIDFTTMVEILKSLNLLDEKANILSARYMRDIIELIKRAQHMSDINSKMKNQLQAIINTVHDGIVALDGKGSVSVFNPIAEKIFGFSREEILGRSLKDKSIEIFNEENMESEKFVKVNEKQIVINSSIVNESDVISGMVYTLKDVTEIQRLEEELRRKLRSQENFAKYTFDDIVGNSNLVESAKSLAKKIAGSHSPILIQGESGTGKELFAQAIHNDSDRNKGPFIAVNFAALSESLLESELFGYEEGAFTGAKKGGMPGLFEQAHGGTIFLDEIGDAPLSFQVRLLRVLQEKQVRRIGGLKVIPIDIRVISATNKDLKELIEKGMFRQDLYYRLNVLPLRTPCLRDRKQDILILAELFYNKYFNERPPIKSSTYFGKIKESLLFYDWPGNIRELRNVVEYLVNVCPNTAPVPQQLPVELVQFTRNNGHNLDSEDEQIERSVISEIYRANQEMTPIGRRSISRNLGISENRVRNIIKYMCEKGYIRANRGVKGLEVLDKGIEFMSDF